MRLGMAADYNEAMNPVVADQISEFFGCYPTRKYRRGQILWHAHEQPSQVYHLLEGRVKQYDISYRGDEVVVNVFKPPAFFPMSVAINGTQNAYFFEAETDLELNAAPIVDVLGFMHANPDVVFDLLARVYRGADGLLGRLTHLMAGSARSRIMYELMIQGRRFGQPGEIGTAIPASESDIGAQAGLARETVNREINKLKRDGLIKIQGGAIVIVDLSKLAESVSREL
jgi:CRP/FNR family transcriptional regulator